MRKNISLKVRLFEQGVTLTQLVFKRVGVYACPMCLDFFDHQDLREGKLTLEHVPTRQTGGKGIILTCKKCNNRSGHLYEGDIQKKHQLTKAISALILLENDSSHRFKMNLLDIETDVKLQARAGGIKIEVLKNTNNPRLVAEQLQRLRNLSAIDFNDLNFSLSVSQRFKERNIELSYLKSAYLACIAKFGYSIINTITFGLIRKQIVNPHEQLFDGFLAQYEMKNAPKNRIVYNDTDDVIHCMFRDGKVVTLPAPGDGFEKYNSFIQSQRNSEKFQLRAIEHEWPQSFEGVFDLH